MVFDLLSSRSDSAAANMAADLLLLQHYPQRDHARFRHYGWHRPAITFGYSQKIAWVREQLPVDATITASDFELCRRPTGGGVVDHRDDWTYALVIPRGHDLGDARATVAYAAIHRAVTDCLTRQGVAAELKEHCEPCDDDAPGPGVCFTKPELHDVIHATTGAKLAGAAQKRSKHGLLFQGSIARGAVGEIDWELFHGDFTAALATLLAAEAHESTWPELWDEALDPLAESYATPEWIERR
ncbi:lipoyl protein ligase domain-containing protein [Actomonas aquatica]|uniref:Lipoate--protein ligase family protein n=1 Tax=Actomonas aquatica TaxID=2866162 RepID=A0ABZ1C378_9BACT|nr:lipoate--protein ligase family protein [Opitutus sp. WL0086]WRQ86144.1 lipoate--protein ligase family protein [Opitutus sp. WL0086]